MSRKINIILTCAALAAVSVGLAEPALASSGGSSLPWESPLEKIQQSITGPVAGFIALAAVAIAGAMLIFGGELNDFARRLCYVALVGGVLLGATQIVALFGATGASIGEAHSRAGRSMTAPTMAPATAGEGAHG
ncbi:conjugal transfer protein TrbC [Rhizobium sp. CG5]|uniref:conjugal transfer pilin TrbC n=1 Tax=Rhizobium sp. CG5 TaxID=2726076 RepID=UPI0020337849|nr:conjugal transfer pilin TrbC [Rhizobium sp. CG5]MCM2476166.1 conjugal transfer protein TrbC [Rhizobium sp. CG5]